MQAAIKRVLVIARKEFTHAYRDWRIIVAVLVLPLIQLLLFAYAISFDVRNVPTVVLDNDNTAASRAYILAASNTGFFRVDQHASTYAQIDEAFKSGSARSAIIVGKGFGNALADSGKGPVTVLVDGSEPNSAALGRTYALALNNVYGRAVLAEWATVRGVSPPAVGALDPRVRNWYNPTRSSADFLVPGLMVVIIMIVTAQQTAVTLVRERVEGTLEQLLLSPVRQGELVIGKVLPWAILGFLDTVGITLAAILIFHVPLRGDVAALAAGMFAFILCSLSIGLVISAVAPSLESANLVAILVSFLPGFMLSGMAFPLATIPPVLQAISYAFPGRYMVDISRGVFLRGTGWGFAYTRILELCLYAAIGLTLATVLNRRRA